MSARRSKRKKLLLVSAVGVLIILLAVGYFYYARTDTVTGSVKDIATQQPIANVKVQVANKTGITDSNGDYTIEGLRFYQQKNLSVITPDGYNSVNPARLVFTSNRKLSKNIVLEPTLTHIVNLLDTASINHQYDYLWTFMYPDDQTYWGGKDAYTTLLKQRDDYLSQANITTKSLSVGANIRHMDTWLDPVTNKTYNDVMEVPISGIEVTDSKEQPQTTLDYYKKVGGFYHYFTSVNKQQLQDAINAYKALTQ